MTKLPQYGTVAQSGLTVEQKIDIVRLRMSGWTRKKIAEKYGRSPERIRQICSKALSIYSRVERSKDEELSVYGKVMMPAGAKILHTALEDFLDGEGFHD